MQDVYFSLHTVILVTVYGKMCFVNFCVYIVNATLAIL